MKKIEMIETNSRKIESITDEAVTFTDGSKMTYDHECECCEDNYADFKQIDDIASDYTFEGDMIFYRHGENGFMFGDLRRQFFVPCYSAQNGYYTYEVDIYFNGVKVLEVEGAGRDEEESRGYLQRWGIIERTR